MQSNFNDCLTRLLKDEGGYSNTPGDNGGPTNFGITIADYRMYIKKSGTASDVKNMSVSQAAVIYKTKYWDALGCDTLPSGVDYTCFDYGVNSGLGRPRRALQRFKSKTGTDLINAINDERTAFLRGLAATQAHDQQFLKGWMARVMRVRSYSLILSQKVPQAPKTIAGVYAGLFAGAAAAGRWGFDHWKQISISAIIVGLIAYAAIHYYHKSKQ